jgi:hypothetical protein
MLTSITKNRDHGYDHDFFNCLYATKQFGFGLEPGRYLRQILRLRLGQMTLPQLVLVVLLLERLEPGLGRLAQVLVQLARCFARQMNFPVLVHCSHHSEVLGLYCRPYYILLFLLTHCNSFAHKLARLLI